MSLIDRVARTFESRLLYMLALQLTTIVFSGWLDWSSANTFLLIGYLAYELLEARYPAYPLRLTSGNGFLRKDGNIVEGLFRLFTWIVVMWWIVWFFPAHLAFAAIMFAKRRLELRSLHRRREALRIKVTDWIRSSAESGYRIRPAPQDMEPELIRSYLAHAPSTADRKLAKEYLELEETLERISRH